VIFLLLFTGSSFANEQDAEFLDGLRERRLFELAEHYCQQQLDVKGLSPDQRGKLVVQQIRNLATHAMNAGSAARPALWSQATAISEDFVTRHPRHSRRLVVRFQHAIAIYSRFDSTPDTEPAQRRLQIIRKAIRELETVSREVKRATNSGRGGLSEEEIHSLQNHVELRLARILLKQAHVYPAKQIDRLALVTQAVDRLTKLDLRLSDRDELKTPLKIELAIARRMGGDAAHAQRILIALKDPTLSHEHLMQIEAEQIRAEIATGNVAAALRIAQTRAAKGTSSLPDRELASLQAVLAQWRAAGGSQQPKQSDRWKRLALDFVRRIEDQHGPFWGRKADQILIGAIPRGSVSSVTDIEILLRAANNLVRKRNLDAALGAYERAAEAASKVKSDPLRFRALFLAARVCQQQKKQRAYLNRLRRLSLELKKEKDAPTAHLMAIRQSYLLAAQDAQGIALYESTLTEHLKHWLNHETASEAAWRLGRLHQVNSRWSKAVDTYRVIPPGNPYSALAMDQVALCWTKAILQLKLSRKPVDEEVGRAVSWFQSRYRSKGTDGKLVFPKVWTPEARAAILAETKLRLQFRGGDRVRDQLLAARDGLPVASAKWLAQAESWLVAAASTEQNWSAAQAHARQISAEFPVEVIGLLSWLEGFAKPATGSQIGQLIVQITDRMAQPAAAWNKAQREQVSVFRGQGLEAIGRRADALKLYRDLAVSYPRNAVHQERLAGALLKSNVPLELKESLTKWRHVNRFSRPGTERWFRSKYGIALAEFKLGNKKRAGQLIRFLQATPPGFSKSKLKDQFLALLKKCE